MRAVALFPAALLALLAACRSSGGVEPAKRSEIEVAIEGNESFDSAELEPFVRQELGAARRLDKAAVDDAAFALELFYLKRGFREARVDYEYAAGETAPIALFRIVEGVQVRIAELSIEGESAFPEELLRETLEDCAPGRPFVEIELENDLRDLRQLYVEQGFLRVAIGREVVDLDERKSSVAIRVTIEEGPAFHIRSVEFSGGVPELEPSLQELGPGWVGRVYTPRVLHELRALVLELHGRSGRPDSEARVGSELEDDGSVRLTVELVPGPRVRIGAIEIHGNERTREELIRGRLELGPGDTYDSEEIQESFRKLYATGLFESVRIELGGGTGEERVLVVQVVEAPTLEVAIEPGWGSYEGPRLGLRVDEKNLFGTGFGGFLDGSVSPLAQRAKLGVTHPSLFGSDVTGEASVFASHREEPAFTSSELGAGLNFGYRWNPRWSATAGYEIRQERLSDVEVDLTLDPEALEDAEIAAVHAGVSRDTRDNVLLPRNGGRARAEVEWAAKLLGSRIDYLQGNLDLLRLFPLGSRLLLASSLRTGMIAPLAETESIPLQERFFNGGENTVRSFEEDELGPKDASGTPVGGEAFTVLSFELRGDIAGNLEGALFYDVGNVVLEHEDYFDLDGFRTGVGVGLRYLLPIGPLRLDLGHNPSARDDEEEYVLHFSVGFPY